MVVKTFRGLLADGGQHRLNLHTNNGKTGYRIVKFDVMPNLPGTADYESTVQIFKTEQTSISTTTATVDFSNSDLMAALFFGMNMQSPESPVQLIIDPEIVNQDIYVTHTATTGNQQINYFIELEVIPLASDEATVATLKNIRTNA